VVLLNALVLVSNLGNLLLAGSQSDVMVQSGLCRWV
jgi:hypothetical protein